jgi:hypothetical protein
MPKVICRHGLTIRRHWTECPGCVADNSPSEEELRQQLSQRKVLNADEKNRYVRKKNAQELQRICEGRKPKQEPEKYTSRPVEPKNEKSLGFLWEMLIYGTMGLVAYLLVGRAGCFIRVGTGDWSGQDPWHPFAAFTHEAVIAFLIVVGICFLIKIMLRTRK